MGTFLSSTPIPETNLPTTSDNRGGQVRTGAQAALPFSVSRGTISPLT